jgi:hypothetical protein
MSLTEQPTVSPSKPAVSPSRYQSGLVGPISYYQDNSGVNTDTTTSIVYTPQQFGAPATAQIIPATVNQSYYVSRGKAYVQDLNINEESITFQVYTQAADNGWFGHHSGAITVNTSFQWESQ